MRWLAWAVWHAENNADASIDKMNETKTFSMDSVYGHQQKSLDKEGTSALPDRVGVTNLSYLYLHVMRGALCLSHQSRPPTRDPQGFRSIDVMRPSPLFVS